jgi:hypothetical protein
MELLSLKWKKAAALALAGTLLSSLTPAFAAESSMTLDGVDLAPAVAYYKTVVKTLDQPTSLFNWSPGGKDGFWSQERSDDDPALLRVAQNSSRSFWISYGNPNDGGNMYGRGLYGAMDPVSTSSYGGGGDTAVLLQLKLPKGLRMLDVRSNEDGPLKKAALDIGAKFNCPSSVDGMFSGGGSKVPPSCQKFVRKIFQELLPIDFFIYSYGATNFKECAQNQMVAFVVTRPDWIQQELVRYFTVKSTLHKDERAMIQTLMLISQTQSTQLSEGSYALLFNFLSAHPKHVLRKSTAVCDAADCQLTAQFCDPENHCEDVALEKLPRPGGPNLSAAESLRNKAPFFWSDLEGFPKSKTVQTWLQKNYLGCDGKNPFTGSK